MIELEADVGRIELTQPFYGFGGGRLRRIERFAGNCFEICFAETVKFGGELGRSRRTCSQRIDVRGQMAVGPDGIDQLCCAGNFSKELFVGGYRRGCRRLSVGRLQANRTEGFRKAEELAPGLVNRVWIAPIRLVGFGYVSIIEDARDGLAGHAPNLMRTGEGPIARSEELSLLTSSREDGISGHL